MQSTSHDKEERLQAQLEAPTKWVERRSDQLVDVSGEHAWWQVDQQIRMPMLLSDDVAVEASVDDYILSIGFFAKKRFPDLVVSDATKTVVPIVERNERAKILTDVLIGRFQTLLDADGAVPHAKYVEAISVIRFYIERIVVSPEGIARQAYAQLEQFTTRFAALRECLTSDTVLENLNSLVSAGHILVWVRAKPGERILLSYTYSQKSSYPTLRETLNVGTRLGPKRIWLLVRWLLMELGMVAAPLRVKLAGANHAASFYFMVSPPVGTKIEAIYWHQIVPKHSAIVPADAPKWTLGDPERPRIPSNLHRRELLPHESANAVLACHSSDCLARQQGGASVDVRIASSSLLIPVLSVATLCCVCWLGRAKVQSLENLVPWLAVIPGALLGLVSQQSSKLSFRLSRTIRYLLLTVSVLSVLFSVSFLLNSKKKDYINADLMNGLLSFVSVVSLFVLVRAMTRRTYSPGSATNGAAVTSYIDVREFRSRMRLAAFLTLLTSLIVATRLSGADDALERQIPHSATVFWRGRMTIFADLSSVEVILAAVLVLSILLFLGGRRTTSLKVSAGYGIAVAATALVKALVRRLRPSQLANPNLVKTFDYSFPSGHAMATSYLLVVCLYLTRRRTRLSMSLMSVGMLVLGVVGVQRLMSGEHWASDVLAGWSIGLLSAVMVLTVLEGWLSSVFGSKSRLRRAGGVSEPAK